jgi:hypothetical protein
MAVTVTPSSAVHTNISATTDAFALVGGKYQVTIMATWGGGSVKLDRLAADGSTYVPVVTFTANTCDNYDIASGSYRLTVATATAVYSDIRAIFTIKAPEL